jgi:hypothetical protein
MARTPRGRKPKAPPATEPIDNVGATELDTPVFSQPAPTPDPVQFEVKHPSDNPAYKQIDALNREHKLAPLPFPATCRSRRSALPPYSMSSRPIWKSK